MLTLANIARTCVTYGCVQGAGTSQRRLVTKRSGALERFFSAAEAKLREFEGLAGL